MDAASEKKLPRMPASVPVMVLGGAALLPHNCLPLYIFEPRYRLMLERALMTDRLLAIATPEPGEEDRVRGVGCLGVIRAAVRHADGTSRLILEGLCRVRFSGWEQIKPFRQARFEAQPLGVAESPAARESRLVFLRSALRRFEPGLPPELSTRMAQISHPEILLDVAAGVLLNEEVHRQAVLEEFDGVLRQRLMLRLLEEISPA
jgi:Lon protease-like protein